MIKLKRVPYLNLLPIILISLIMYKLVNNIEFLVLILNKLLSLMEYFVWGFCIAYLLNPLMIYLEKKFNTHRVMSLLIIYLIFLSFIALLIVLVIPGMIQSIIDFLGSLPDYIAKADAYINTYIMNNNTFIKYGVNSYITSNLNNIIDKLNSLLKISLNVVFSNVINFSSTLFKFIAGIAISVYLLKDKEAAINYLKKFLYTFLNESQANSILEIGSKINLIFKEYVIGKSLVSLVIGIICFLALQIMSVQYALLIGIIIGVTNLIPYFGSIVGFIPSLVITLFAGWVSVLKLLVLVSALSLFDGWYLSPRIISTKVGLNPIWIIFAITIGGGMYGVIGMILSVPFAAIIKTFLVDYIDKKAEAKRLT